MSGRIYDSDGHVYCSKCGSEMTSSRERNFYGPFCKNRLCDGCILDAVYIRGIMEYRYLKIKSIKENLGIPKGI